MRRSRRTRSGGAGGQRKPPRAGATMTASGSKMPRATAIVVAAGEGRRLGGKVDKAFTLVGGKPLLSYSLLALERSPEIESVVVVVRRSAVPRCRELVRRLELNKIEAVVAGGRRRQDSVRNGLRFARASEYVLVHDAARPFLNRRLVAETLAACMKTGAAIAAEPVSATVKRAKAGRVAATVPRETLWLAQTPQAFRRALLERAFNKWPSGLEATDDAAIVERAGAKVALVPGDSFNIKITYPVDVAVAEALLKARKPGGKG